MSSFVFSARARSRGIVCCSYSYYFTRFLWRVFCHQYVMIFEKIPKMVSIRGSEMAIFVKKEPLTHKTHTPSNTANVPKYPINRIID